MNLILPRRASTGKDSRSVPPDTTGVGWIYRVHVTPDGRSYVYSYLRALNELYLVEGLK